MVFISIWFYIFLAVLLAVYYLLPIRFRWCALLAANLVFYGYLSIESPVCFIILIAVSFICWIICRFGEPDGKLHRLILYITVPLIAGALLFVKEGPYLLNVLVHKSMPGWWIVPVGFSFFSLQLISYAVDVYRGTVSPEKNYFKFLLFVSFFPQIIQGPIPRYSQLSDQLVTGHRFDEKEFVKGFMLILWGFFLKLCIADKSAVIVDRVFDNAYTYQGAYVLVAGSLYNLQLYADFLAYTSFAQGIAELFGIHIIDNFDHPYFATSVKDFWRRWHLSLSSWLKDYVYIPLGGNRKGKLRKYINILITFTVSGIWHGGGLKFPIWGMIHGIYQIIGEILTPLRTSIAAKLRIRPDSPVSRFFKILVTFILLMLAEIIFRADHLKTGVFMIRSLFTVYNPWIFTNGALCELGLELKELHLLFICLAILLSVSILQEKGIRLREKILEQKLVIRWIIYIAVILFVIIFGTYGFGYDSQAFIYGDF